MPRHNDIRAANIHEIAASLAAAGSHFFDPGTLRFFGDRVSNWAAHWIGGRLFIRNIGHRPGHARGFPHCTLRGQVREIRTDAEGAATVSQRIERFDGLRPLQILRALETEAAAGAGGPHVCPVCLQPSNPQPEPDGSRRCGYCGERWQPPSAAEPAPEAAAGAGAGAAAA